MAASGLGSIVQGIGAGYQANANAAAYTYKAGVAMLNKQINDQNAQFAQESGDIRSMEEGLKAGQEIGQTKAVQAASGLDVNSGTNLAIRQSQTASAKFDQSVIEWDAEKTAYGYKSRAATDVAEANLDLMGASSAKKAGTFAELGSFLGGAGNVASKWYQGTTTGVFSLGS